MQVKRVRRPRRKQMQSVVLALELAVLTALLIGRMTCSAAAGEAPQAEPQRVQETASATIRPSSHPQPTTTAEPLEQPWQPDEAEVEYIARTLYGEALIVKSTMQRAAVVWCILNRVDLGTYPDTIEGVVLEKHQFHGYSASHPVTEELRAIAVDVLQRWHSEHEGEADVGRVLPKEYCFFAGDGRENYFSAEWCGTDYWDWSLPNPYED